MDGIVVQLDSPPQMPRLDSIQPDLVHAEFLRRVPIAYAKRFGILGLNLVDGIMPVAMSSPDSLHTLDKLIALLGIPNRAVLADEQTIRQAMFAAYGQQDSGVDRALAEVNSDRIRIVDEESGKTSDLLDQDGAAPVTKLVNSILLEAVKRRASDAHIQTFEDRLQVRFRIDGVLYDYVQPPRELHEEMASRIKVMGKMNIAEKRLAQDGRTTVLVGDKVIDLRISSLPTSYGERVVLRLLDKSARLYQLSELGMSQRDLKTFSRLIRHTHGILLVTGPTGSGKSTTLYAALQELNCRELNIITLEDPIEYQLPGISQTQVSDKKGMTFATGLRAVLRQDPDVIMVGEIRDEATARMAIQSSLTGHLVFSTLHTDDAAGAVARLIDLGIESYLVAASLIGVLAQRLLRCVCPHCRRPRKLIHEEAVALQIDNQDEIIIYDAIGCEVCHQTGYFDRRGIFEMMEVDEEIHNLVVGGARTGDLKRAALGKGMTTLRADAVAKLLAGRTTLDEVLRVTRE